MTATRYLAAIAMLVALALSAVRCDQNVPLGVAPEPAADAGADAPGVVD